MTREQVLKLFPEATDEQITNLLNQSNGELEKEKQKSKAYKADADKAKELQAKIYELEAGNLTEVEKANKDLEVALGKIADMEKENDIRDQREAAMYNFKIDADQAKKVVKDDGTLDYEALGKIITDKETASAQAKEKEIADGGTNPGGGSGGGSGSGEEKTADVLNAESISFGNATASAETKNHYVI